MNIIRRPFRYRDDNVVYWLIGINLLIFVLTWLLGRYFNVILSWGKSGERLLQTCIFLLNRMPMVPEKVINQKWLWTLVTYMFMHGGLRHVFFNMFGLFIFGVQVERQMGSREFLLYYLLTGMMAGIFTCAVYYFTGAGRTPFIGASGALFAVELAYAVYFPNSIIYLWGILPLRAPVLVLGYTALELVFSITGRNDGIAHFTHLAGFGTGWLYFLVRFGVSPWRRLTGR